MSQQSKFLETFVLVALSGLMIFALNRWFVPQKSAPDVVESGQKIEVLRHEEVAQPLKTEVDFIDTPAAGEATSTTVETDLATYTFSNHGAILTNLVFKKSAGNLSHPFATLTPITEENRHRGAFLVAFEQATPYDYTLVDMSKKGTETHVVYRAITASGTITKTFVISHDTYKIDLLLDIAPAANVTLQPRIYLPAPSLQHAAYSSPAQAVTTTPRGALETLDTQKVIGAAWAKPSIFGAAERYFVHTLVADSTQKATRGYFRVDNDQLITIVEGKKTAEPLAWLTSWYCGPKEHAALVKVDARLDSLLDFGWLSLPSKGILWLLEVFFTYVKNYGIAIILLALIMKLALLPFTLRGEKSVKSLGEFQKKMQYIDQRYKGDPERIKAEREEYIRKNGLPTGSQTGCLFMFVQIPVFIALNRVLSGSIELYQAPFLWIPDLSAKDPYYVLPGIVAISMFLMQPDQQDPRQGTASLFIAVLFAGIVAQLSAGLALSIAASTLAAVVQTMVTKRFKRS